MKSLFILPLFVMATLISPQASAQWIVNDPANTAQAIIQVKKLVEQINQLQEQIDIQTAVRDAARRHRDKFIESLDVGIGFDVDGYLHEHMRQVRRFGSGDGVNPYVIHSGVRSEKEVLDYFSYGDDPNRFNQFDPEEHTRVRKATINEGWNQVRDARGRLTDIATEMKSLAEKAGRASTPEERRTIQIEMIALQVKQQNEMQMLQIAEDELDHFFRMDQEANVALQRKMMETLNQGLIDAGNVTEGEMEARIKAVEQGKRTRTGKKVCLRPSFKKAKNGEC